MPEQQRRVNRDQFEGILRGLGAAEAGAAQGVVERQGNLPDALRQALAQHQARRRVEGREDPRKSQVAMRLLRYLAEGVPDLAAVAWYVEHGVDSGDLRQGFIKELVRSGLVEFRGGVLACTQAGFGAVRDAAQAAGMQGCWGGIDGIPEQPATWVWAGGGEFEPAACDVLGHFQPEMGRFHATFTGAHQIVPFFDRVRLIRCERAAGGICRVRRIIDLAVVSLAGTASSGCGERVVHTFTYAKCGSRDVDMPVRRVAGHEPPGPNRVYTDDAAKTEATVYEWKGQGKDVRVGYCPLLSPDFDMAVECGADHVYLRVGPERAEEMLHRFRERGVVIWDARGPRRG